MSKKRKSEQEPSSSPETLEKAGTTVGQEAAAVAVAPILTEQPKIEFDTWYAMRSHLIPPHHLKEIIKADFKGRGVPSMATIAEFDEALRKYGVII